MGRVAVLFLAILIVLPSTAMAYMDPGTGSTLISAIIGACVATAITVKTYWYKLKSLFEKGDSDDLGLDG